MRRRWRSRLVDERLVDERLVDERLADERLADERLADERLADTARAHDRRTCRRPAARVSDLRRLNNDERMARRSDMDRDRLILLGDLNYVEALREQTRSCGGTIIEEDGVVLLKGPGPHPILNYAVRLDASVNAKAAIAVMTDFFGAHRHGFTLVLRNSDDESDLGDAAKRMGLVDLLAPPEMIVESRLPAKSLPLGSELRAVEDDEGLEDFRQVAAEAWMTYGIPSQVTGEIFGRPDLVTAPHVDAVVCYERDRPASAALGLLSHGIAGIYWVSTVSAARGKGYAEACTRWITNRAFDRGVEAVSLQASPMGHPIYRRMGFTDIATYRLLASLPADT